MSPKLNHRRATLVLGRIDEILAWEARHENDRDTKFVQLGKYSITRGMPSARTRWQRRRIQRSFVT